MKGTDETYGPVVTPKTKGDKNVSCLLIGQLLLLVQVIHLGRVYVPSDAWVYR